MNENLQSEIDPLDPVAEEFLERFRNGERPPVSEYVERYPDLADRIRQLFPALVLMERGAPSAAGAETGPFGATVHEAAATRPHVLGDFRILREVGHGGMGVVYEAVQESLGRHVALKVLPTALLRKGKFLERFKREARAAGRLHHTNIVPVHGVGEHQGTHFIVMQFIHGQGLDEVLQEVRRLRDRPLSNPGSLVATMAGNLLADHFEPFDRTQPQLGVPAPPDASPSTPPINAASGAGLGRETSAHYFRAVARLGLQAAQALAYAHSQGIIHRDVKPSNLLLDMKGTVWVTDFGLAKADDSDNLTDSGDILGTLRYMAPERFSGQADARTDVYALGVTLFEMLALRPAFDEANRLKLIDQISRSGPLSPRTLEPAVPRDLDTIIQKASARDAADRYQTATDFADDLQHFLDDRPIRARRSSPVERLRRWARRNPLVAGLAALVAGLSLAIMGVLLASNARLERKSADLAEAVKVANENEELANNKRQEAERERLRALDEEWSALMASLRAGRYSGRQGQRFNGLETVRKALRPELLQGRSPAEMLSLRNEAIASLCLPDVEVAEEWKGWPPDGETVDFDPFFTRYVCADRKGNVFVYRVGDGTELMRLPNIGRVASYGGLLFSPNGRYLGHLLYPRKTGGNYRLWRVDGSEAREALREQRTVNWATFRHDGAVVALLLDDGSIVLRETATGRELKVLKGTSPFTTIEFHPFRPNLLACAFSNGLRVVDCESGRVLMELKTEMEPRFIAWHPEGETLATGVNRSILLVNADTGRLTVPPLAGHLNSGLQARFNHAGDLLASTDWTSTLYLWDVRTGKQLLESPQRMFQQILRFSPDDTRLAGQATGDKVQLFRVAPGRECGRVLRRKDLGPKGSGSYTQDNPVVRADGRVAAAAVEGGCVLLDLERREELALIGRGRVAAPLGFAADGALWTGRDDIRRWPVGAKGADARRYGPPQTVLALDGDCEWGASADQKVVAAISKSPAHTCMVVHLAEPVRYVQLGKQNDVRNATASPDGRYVVTGSHVFGTVEVWDAHTGQKIRTLASEGGMVRFSPDGRWLAGTMTSGKCLIWKVGSWQQEVAPIADANGLFPAFSPDGSLLALHSEQGFVRLLRPDTGAEVARLFTPDKTRLQPGCFTPDGSRLLARGVETGMLYVWDLHRIRARLRPLGLDWEETHPPRAANDRPPAPVHVSVQP
jgi:serine/threonine protein kinase/WD40 repeat protein